MSRDALLEDVMTKTTTGTITLHVPEKMAAATGAQFEPTTEVHHFGFVVKVVNPGCTLEVQIEERSGRVTRLTTTEDQLDDHAVVRRAVFDAVERMLKEFGI